MIAAACRGAARVAGQLVIGVLPDAGQGQERQSTAEVDVALFTGMGQARNVINVLSAVEVESCCEAIEALLRSSGLPADHPRGSCAG